MAAIGGTATAAAGAASSALIKANTAKDKAQAAANQVGGIQRDIRAEDANLTSLKAKETAIAAEVAKFEPRFLENQQIRRISQKLRPFTGTPFDLSMQVELDPMNLTDQIEDAITGGGWREQSVPTGEETFARIGRIPVGIRSVAGVWILFPEKYQDAGVALMKALNDEKILASANLITKPRDPQDMVVHVWVGANPASFLKYQPKR